MRRGHLDGERYCGNYTTKEVHDLINEQLSCNIDELIDSGDDIPFDSLEIATQAGYKFCEYCLKIK